MSESSIAFEKRVERIHRLLEQEDADVTWNDRIPDPDNPTQSRQIDVTIKRGDRLTIVECRIHKDSQDVKWIEELMGQRVSLRADAVIAVSNSGFTQGAEIKARNFGIILRDFNTLTQEEIKNWGKQRKVHLTFYEFTDNVICFRLPAPPVPPIIITDYDGKPVVWRGLFESLMAEAKNEPNGSVPDAVAECQAEFDAPIVVSGMRVLKTKVTCTCRRLTRDVSLTGVVAYADPLDEDGIPKATVGSLDLGTSEIVEASDTVILVVDLSQISIPANCLFHTMNYDFGRVVEVRGTQTIGLPDAMQFQNTIRFCFETQ